MEDRKAIKTAAERVEAYYRGCAKVALVIVAVGVVVVGIGAGTIFHALRHHWPPIRNPDVLYRDCQVFMSRYPQEMDPPHDKWPQSVRDLNPIHLTVISEHSAFIVMSFGGISGPDAQWGYLEHSS